MSTEDDLNRPASTGDPSGPDTPRPDQPYPSGPTGSGASPHERTEAAAALITAVDGLAHLGDQPVHTHAARYHDVHTLLQDALTDTDR